MKEGHGKAEHSLQNTIVELVGKRVIMRDSKGRNLQRKESSGEPWSPMF